MGEMTEGFEELKAQCVREGRLYEDEDFPASSDSIHPGRNRNEDKLWKRPRVRPRLSLSFCYHWLYSQIAQQHKHTVKPVLTTIWLNRLPDQ